MTATPKPTVKVLKKTKFGSSFAVIADVTMSTSYQAGGDTLPASVFGHQVIEFVVPEATDGTHTFKYDHVNGKLKAYASLGTEVSANTDLSTYTVRVLAIGY